MDGRHECIRWCRQYGLLATQMFCPTCNRQRRERALDCGVDCVTQRYPIKGCKKNDQHHAKQYLSLPISGAEVLKSEGECQQQSLNMNSKSGARIPQLTETSIAGTQPSQILQIFLSKLEALDILLKQPRTYFPEEITIARESYRNSGLFEDMMLQLRKDFYWQSYARILFLCLSEFTWNQRFKHHCYFHFWT